MLHTVTLVPLVPPIRYQGNVSSQIDPRGAIHLAGIPGSQGVSHIARACVTCRPFASGQQGGATTLTASQSSYASRRMASAVNTPPVGAMRFVV